jgi:hypothetical protein
MKTIPFILFFAVLTVISSHFSSVLASAEKAQAGPAGCFNEFKVQGQSKNVCLTWSVTTPEVKQFVIERSFDGDYYDTISAMNCNGTTTHQFADMGAEGRIVYYRITAVKSDATIEKSSVETIKPAQHG